MKNPLTYLKHIVKDPINNIAEADARKKEIMPLLYGSLGVLVLGLILQIAAKLDFMMILSLIGLIGVGFCGFLFVVISSAKKRFEGLTCLKCHALAEIKTPEDFNKYIAYAVQEDKAVFSGYSGNKQATNGVYSQVKFSGYAKAVVAVNLTCPHCGEVKHLKYTAEPFKCHAQAKNVGVLQFEAIYASLESAVKTALNHYNDPELKKTLPYTFHSSKNPLFEQRTTFKGANSAGARPDYFGAQIDYRKDIEEMLEHYFVLNELNGTLVSLDGPVPAAAKTEATAVPAVTETENPAPAVPAAAETERPVAPAVPAAAETMNSVSYTAPVVEETDSPAPPAAQYAPTAQPAPSVVPQHNTVPDEQAPSQKKAFPLILIIAIVCAILVVGGVLFFLFGLKDNTDNKPEPPTATTTTSTQSVTSPTEESAQPALNMNDFIGYWSMQDDSEKELTIHSCTHDSLNFSLEYYGLHAITNVASTLQNDVAEFSLAVDGAVIKGSLTFAANCVTVQITQSTLGAMPAETMVFTEQHLTSWLYTEEEYEDPDDYEDYYGDLPEEEPYEPTTDEPYLFKAENDGYYIYSDPTYMSYYIDVLPAGIYTIIEEQYDESGNLWGRLKSGLGWVCVKEAYENTYSSDYILTFSSDRLLTESDLYFLSDSKLMIAINEIFARHGRRFDDEALQSYFDSKYWYEGYIEPEDFSEDMLTDIEKQNVQFLLQYRNSAY